MHKKGPSRPALAGTLPQEPRKPLNGRSDGRPPGLGWYDLAARRFGGGGRPFCCRASESVHEPKEPQQEKQSADRYR